MSYKIILCEDSGVVAVPEGWEIDGILYWPPFAGRTLHKARTNALSKPESNWHPEKCIVKKSGVLTFREAMDLEEKFEKMATDDEEYLKICEKSNERFRSCKVQPILNYKYDSMFTDTEISNDISTLPKIPSIPPNTPSEITQISNINSQVPVDSESNLQRMEKTSKQVLDITEEFNQYSSEFTNTIDLTATIEKICSEMQHEAIKELDKKVEDMKHYFLTEFAKLNVKCDEILKNIGNFQNEFPKYSNNEQNLDTDIDSIALPLKTVEEVKCLEENLLDPGFRKTVVRKLVMIGGTNGNGDWSKLGYKVLYEIFTYELLNCFSWTGIRKTTPQTGESKLPFLKYQKLVEVIYEVVKLGDKNFTKTINENFIKTALRNAKLRLDRHKKKEREHVAALDRIHNEEKEK